MGTGTFTENGNQMTLVLNLTGSIPGSRGVHVHVSGDCTNPGAHFNPDAVMKNGEFDSIVVNDAGVGTMTSIRMGLSLDLPSDGGTGIVGRSLNVHGLPILAADGGPVLTDAGTPVPAPRIGCGVIQ
jgi:Cu/Zn superoxide dismutase